MQGDARLHSRLLNCLQTILDLEPNLQCLQMTQVLSQEFTMLKDICARIETLCIYEEDVLRIENATAVFLAELEEPLKNRCAQFVEQRIVQ